MEKLIKIDITLENAKLLQQLSNRYYNGLFKDIVHNEDEEMKIRDTLAEVSRAIDSSITYDSKKVNNERVKRSN